MKPRIKLDEVLTPDGMVLALYAHDGGYSISLKGQELMHSKASASEELLGRLGVERLAARPEQSARVLVGGLGLGFTLRSVLEVCDGKAQVEVAELIPEVVEWNHTHLRQLNGQFLEDPRVTVRVADVGELIRGVGGNGYDSILLDVDNGPLAMVAKVNRSLYSHAGIRAIKAALRPGGRAVLWSAGPDPAFEGRLRHAGFAVRVVPAKVHERAKRAAYLLYVADVD